MRASVARSAARPQGHDSTRGPAAFVPLPGTAAVVGGCPAPGLVLRVTEVCVDSRTSSGGLVHATTPCSLQRVRIRRFCDWAEGGEIHGKPCAWSARMLCPTQTVHVWAGGGVDEGLHSNGTLLTAVVTTHLASTAPVRCITATRSCVMRLGSAVASSPVNACGYGDTGLREYRIHEERSGMG